MSILRSRLSIASASSVHVRVEAVRVEIRARPIQVTKRARRGLQTRVEIS